MELATEKQIDFLNSLLLQELDERRRQIYLEREYEVETSRNLTKEEASEVIERFHPDNEDRKKHFEDAHRKVADVVGQQTLFD